MSDRFYVTTPIYYVNDKPTIGTAYTTIAADVLARYFRLRGRRVHFLTGTDENAEKTVDAAEARGMDVKAHTDDMAEVFKKTWEILGLTHDDFIRTTEDRHILAAHRFLNRLEEAGDIYKGHYEGLYCKGCAAYLTPTELGDGGICPTHKTKPEEISEDNYFFRLSKYEKPLLDYYEANPDFVKPGTRYNEVVSFIRNGLKDISVTRPMKSWGMPYPTDPTQVVYVWIEALTNYISAIGYADSDDMEWWPADVHLIGKDIIRFHCVFWPAMLMSAGLPLPKQVFAHGFFTVDGQRMGKSLGNAVDPLYITENFGVDAMRYYLFAEFPFGSDGDFSFDSLKNRINHDLGNDLGNLLNRLLKMVSKYRGGVVPEAGAAADEDAALISAAKTLAGNIDDRFEKIEIGGVIEDIWLLIREANRYIDIVKPFSLAKDDSEKTQARLDAVLYNLVEALRITGTALAPLMPDTSRKICGALGCAPPDADILEALTWGTGASGAKTADRLILFPRIED